MNIQSIGGKKMQEFYFQIHNPVGMHVRPAGLLVKEALKYDCEVRIRLEEKSADAKHILSLLNLGAKAGDEIWVSTHGADEEAAARDLHRFMSDHAF